MADLSKEFLKQAISTLLSLQDQLSQVRDKTLSDDFIKHYFQKLHTLKGSSQTFNFNNLAIISHEIEDILQAIQKKQISQNQSTYKVIQESFTILIKTAKSYQEDSQPIDYKDFFTQIREINLKSADLPEFDFSEHSISKTILERLSAQEKSKLNLAIQNKTNLFVLEANFTMSNFYHGFKNLKEVLDNSGQVIAVLPNSGENRDNMSLQILYSAKLSGEKIKDLLKSSSAKITFEIAWSSGHFLSDTSEMLNNLIAVSKRKSFQLNKNINFELCLDHVEIPAKYLLLINEIGSHLLNNAVDHAIESPEQRIQNDKNKFGKITVSLLKMEDGILLIVEDDGKGINLYELSKTAVENNLNKSDHNLLEKNVLDLISRQGFSASETVSGISGRGVGLAAVKALIDEAFGKIEVETKIGSGTKFSIYLPLN